MSVSAPSGITETQDSEDPHSRKRINAAGDVLIADAASDDQLEWAYGVINNWRSSHSYPLNTFQMWLRKHAREIYQNALVVQRIKRLSSIESKLRRLRWLKLGEMQDIGGCRAVLGSVRSVDRLLTKYRDSRFDHKLDDSDDYIRHPKRSGYRGVHLIYRYVSRRKKAYSGLKIEVQLRSPLQHAWATTVETVDTFTRQALKSNQGEKEWARFFALMGSALAQREGTPLVPGTPTGHAQLVSELRKHAVNLQVEARLAAYSAVIKHLDESGTISGAHYFLIALDSERNRTRVTGYMASESVRAVREYVQTENEFRRRRGTDAVLVSAESLTSLKRAFPNYFADTSAFAEALRMAMS